MRFGGDSLGRVARTGTLDPGEVADANGVRARPRLAKVAPAPPSGPYARRKMSCARGSMT